MVVSYVNICGQRRNPSIVGSWGDIREEKLKGATNHYPIRVR